MAKPTTTKRVAKKATSLRKTSPSCARRKPSQPTARAGKKTGSKKPDPIEYEAGSKTAAIEHEVELPRPGSKLALLIELLKRKQGVTVAEASDALGWQHHSIRGAIIGALKKRHRLNVTSTVAEGRGRVYRITNRS